MSSWNSGKSSLLSHEMYIAGGGTNGPIILKAFLPLTFIAVFSFMAVWQIALEGLFFIVSTNLNAISVSFLQTNN